jgi:hypothetical protein
MMRIVASPWGSVMQALYRFALVLGLPFLAIAAAQAEGGAAVVVGSFEPAGGATDGKADCPGVGGFDDLVYVKLTQLPSGDFIIDLYRRQEDGGVTSILLSRQHSCAFRRMEFHSPARAQPPLPPPSPPPPVPRPTR